MYNQKRNGINTILNCRHLMELFVGILELKSLNFILEYKKKCCDTISKLDKNKLSMLSIVLCICNNVVLRERTARRTVTRLYDELRPVFYRNARESRALSLSCRRFRESLPLTTEVDEIIPKFFT